MEIWKEKTPQYKFMQFKIDLIVWKYSSQLNNLSKATWFKIDLIVWKCTTFTEPLLIPMRLKQT